MGLILLIQTILTAIIIGFFNINFWYSYLLYLIIIGGILVLFIYITSVASNEKFKISRKLIVLIIILVLTILLNLIFIDLYYFYLNNIRSETFQNLTIFQLSLTKFISYPLIFIITTIIIYLLITLIAVVKIIKLESGPLRIFN